MSKGEMKGISSGRDLLPLRFFFGARNEDIGLKKAYFWGVNNE
jgi:hypothetical protein